MAPLFCRTVLSNCIFVFLLSSMKSPCVGGSLNCIASFFCNAVDQLTQGFGDVQLLQLLYRSVDEVRKKNYRELLWSVFKKFIVSMQGLLQVQDRHQILFAVVMLLCRRYATWHPTYRHGQPEKGCTRCRSFVALDRKHGHSHPCI